MPQIPKHIDDRARSTPCVSSRILGLKKILGGILFLMVLQNPIQTFGANGAAGQSVTLTWSPSTDSNVAGYKIYYGVASGIYTNSINVGNATNATISGLAAGVTYYFAATTYDTFGQESGYSNEALYTVPIGLNIRAASARQIVLTVSGLVGHTYEILATAKSDFMTWIVIGTVTVGAGGSVDFTDPNAANYPARLYRTLEIP